MNAEPNTGAEVRCPKIELRTKVAELCGWKWHKFLASDGTVFSVLIAPDAIWQKARRFQGVPISAPEGNDPDFSDAPHYDSDLNAMHGAEARLALTPFDGRGLNERARYQLNLEQVLREEGHNIRRETWNATARQRAEAFVKTLSK